MGGWCCRTHGLLQGQPLPSARGRCRGCGPAWPLVEGTLPFSAEPCQQLPHVRLRPRCRLPSPPEGRGLECGPGSEGGRAGAGAAASCRGLATEALCESVATPGPSSSAWKSLSMARLLRGSSRSEDAGIRTWQRPQRKSDRGRDGRTRSQEPAERAQGPPRSVLLSLGRRPLGPCGRWRRSSGGCPLRPSQAARTVCGQPHRTSQSAGIVPSWWLPGSAKRCALLRVRCQGPRTPPRTDLSPLCLFRLVQRLHLKEKV